MPATAFVGYWIQNQRLMKYIVSWSVLVGGSPANGAVEVPEGLGAYTLFLLS